MDISFNDDWQEFPSLLICDEISDPIKTILECANVDYLINVREHLTELFQCAILSDRFQKIPGPYQEKIINTYNDVVKMTEAAHVLNRYWKTDALSYCVGGITSSTEEN